MAEGILFNVAGDILAKLGCLALDEVKLVWGVQKEIEKLKGTMSTIRAVLLDAEEKQFTSHAIKDWLMKLEDVMYDVDDLLDSVSHEKMWREALTREKRAKKVRIFFSSSNQLVYGLKFGHRIKSLKESLDAIAKDRTHFHFNKCLVENSMRRRERIPTDSFVCEEDVIGRKQDKKVILHFLLNPDMEEENVSVKSIYGIGGLGKTTLAQSIYNDGQVKEYFQLRKWVCVSNEFDVSTIAKALLDTPDHNNRSEMKQKLVEELNGKRYLIVLDDVWNEERAQWFDLKSLVNGGARGSKILVTTRSKKVAEVCGGKVEPYLLESLNHEYSWYLFCKIAFAGGKEPSDGNLIEIGKAIMKRCLGVPLAIRALASLLYSTSPAQWSKFKDEKLSKIDIVNKDVMPILKLSYDHLPSHLKHCFAYCALFPQDWTFNIKTLVQLWIAQGFVQPSSSDLEDAGYQYCEDLMWRSFFQYVRTDAEGYISEFKMHDLMHDLAWSVSGMKHTEEHCIRVRHIRGSAWQKSSKLNKPRSFLYWSSYTFRIDIHSICKSVSLRVLDLHDARISRVPSCIGQLKHLRYLNLSETLIRKLPNSICRLQNLHTLVLDLCMHLEGLPRGLRKLVNLTYLSTYRCELSYMPSGLDKLTSLLTLTEIVVNTKPGQCKLRELKKLEKLKGSITINCKWLKRLSSCETKDAKLDSKKHLTGLQLTHVKDDAILEALQPQSHLKSLTVFRFSGVKIPNWLSTLTNLVSVYLRECDRCLYVPPVHHLPALKILSIWDLKVLEYIAGHEVLSSEGSFFQSLEMLQLKNLPRLKGWWKTEEAHGNGDHALTAQSRHTEPHLYKFPSLSHLEISNCPNLICFPASQIRVTCSLSLVNETLRHILLEDGIQQPSTSATTLDA